VNQEKKESSVEDVGRRRPRARMKAYALNAGNTLKRRWFHGNQRKNMNRLFAVLSLMLLLTLSSMAQAGTDQLEKVYQHEWCAGKGQTEVVLPDKTRADCVTATHAIEFDFGKKWAESIGQSLYYSLQTGKRAGIVLILQKPSDRKFFIRLNSTIQHFNLPIDTWSVGKGAQ
jgi:hypothetical protein